MVLSFNYYGELFFAIIDIVLKSGTLNRKTYKGRAKLCKSLILKYTGKRMYVSVLRGLEFDRFVCIIISIATLTRDSRFFAEQMESQSLTA